MAPCLIHSLIQGRAPGPLTSTFVSPASNHSSPSRLWTDVLIQTS